MLRVSVPCTLFHKTLGNLVLQAVAMTITTKGRRRRRRWWWRRRREQNVEGGRGKKEAEKIYRSDARGLD